MGYWINIDSTGNKAHRDNIEYKGIYQNCRPQEEKVPPGRWVHKDEEPRFASGSTAIINVDGRNVRVKPCGNCHPW